MFSKLGLSDTLRRAIKEAGYTQPTPIQVRVIPEVLQNKDVMGCAQTGTGKTASFILPLIQQLSRSRTRARMPRALILEPTRELAMQVADNFVTLGKHSNLKHALLIGGHSLGAQEKALGKEIDVIIATPGRLLDMIERGKLLMHGIEILIIDEADRMMDMGFMPEVKSIVAKLSRRQQTLLFSATMPSEIKKLADTLLKNPIEIMVSPQNPTAQTIQQYQIKATHKTKGQKLRALFSEDRFKTTLVFLNRKRAATTLSSALIRDHFAVGLLHGDLTQAKRSETLEAFKKGEIRILIASDVAARGIDIEKLDLVVNYDVPTNAEDYVHRIGRTGRAGQSGIAISFVTPEDKEIWLEIEKGAKNKIAEYKLPKTEEKTHEPQQDRPQKPQKSAPQKGAVQGFGNHVPAFILQSTFGKESRAD